MSESTSSTNGGAESVNRQDELSSTNMLEEFVHTEEENMETDYTSGKRRRTVSEEEEWVQVQRNSKKKSRESLTSLGQTDVIPVDVSVTSKQKLPKQFALAKLLSANNITDICKVKYINQYKIILTFNKEISAQKFLLCKKFDEEGWRRQKTLELALSFGVIKDIELDLTETELLKHISSQIEVATAKRLNRRNEEGWTPSETIKLGFNGSTLPSYVYLFDMRIKVAPYKFPVTQCSRCWRYGHSVKICPSNNIICPKCGGHHENCTVMTFVCPNCSRNHMALSKECPVFIKEKRLREIMTESNCSYQKALTIYVPPSPTHTSAPISSTYLAPATTSIRSPIIHQRYKVNNAAHKPVNKELSYAQVAQIIPAKTSAQLLSNPQNQENIQQPRANEATSSRASEPKKKTRKKKKMPYYIAENVIADLEITTTDSENELLQEEEQREDNRNQEEENQEDQNIFSFLKRIFYSFKKSFMISVNRLIHYVKSVFKSILDNIFTLFNGPEASCVKNLFSYFNG